MDEKEKYLKLYSPLEAGAAPTEILPGRMGGGYGRICWGENMLEPLKEWKIASLLDVGCGYGNFCDAAALFVPRVYGLDIASVATGNVIDNPEITYLDGEAKALPLPDGAVEWITSFDCLEHCLEHDIDKILQEFNRVASKGFVLSISYQPCEADGMPLHMTVKPEAWWIEKLSRYGEVTKEGHAPITEAPYLICRKPVERTMVCYCAGSIGTRLKNIAWTHRLARRTGRRFSLVWLENDPLCRCSFSSLFTNSIPLIPEKELLGLSACKIYAHIKDVADQALISGGKTLRKAVQKWGIFNASDISMDDPEDHVIVYAPKCQIEGLMDDRDNLLFHLTPVPDLQERIQEAETRMAIGKSIMGVHARGGDFGVPPDVYARLIQKALTLNPDQRFLVCSDEQGHEQKLKTDFPQAVAVRSKPAWKQKKDPDLPWALGNVDTCPDAVHQSLVDLYLLARTQFAIYHEASAYAQTGALLSQAEPSAFKRNNGESPENCDLETPDESPARRGMRPEKTAIDPPFPTRGRQAQGNTPHSIYYFCPDIQCASAGIRRLYRHVAILHEAGFPAFLLHEKPGFSHPGMDRVPSTDLNRIDGDPNAIFVLPEGIPRIMHLLKDHPGRRFAIALSWTYVFSTLPDGLDWRNFGIERVLAVSPAIADMIHWSMGLPVHLLPSGIDHNLFYYDPSIKQMQISYIHRKAEQTARTQALLASRNPDYLYEFKWVGLDGLSQEAYAEQIRRSSIFLSTSLAEGFPTACLEAMASGALVAGYDAVGGKEILSPPGEKPTAILAPNGDYVSLAHKLAPVLDDLLAGEGHRWHPVLDRARRTALKYTMDGEASALIDFWASVARDEIGDMNSRAASSTETQSPAKTIRIQEVER